MYAIRSYYGPPGPINIVDDEPATGIDWLPIYAKALQAPAPEYQKGRQGWERGASNATARTVYGWELLYPTWRTGLLQV